MKQHTGYLNFRCKIQLDHPVNDIDKFADVINPLFRSFIRSLVTVAMKTKLTLILFVFCAALALTAAAAVGGNPELDAEWEDFKQRYGKQYDGGDGDADEEV